MDPIKDAFDKIKQDILFLKTEITNLRYEISTLRTQIHSAPFNPTIPTNKPTEDNPPTSTPAHSPAHPTVLYPPITKNNTLSIGNEGVPTDKPTDRQTNQQTNQQSDYANLNQQVIRFSKPITSHSDEFEKAREILDSLDSIKREIRLKFKRLTPQEMQVFSTLYALEDQNTEEITYKLLAQRLNLTESSIRDYITKLVSKGIPILKVRQNNKKIALCISPDLQRIASLSTIIKLREL
jgi:DNA-binding MarR family transcriptional regulator